MNESFHAQHLSPSIQQSVTRLIFKKGDKKDLKNWRYFVISLPNIDYKLCAKALASRLSSVSGSVVDTDKTCSVSGRSIVKNQILIRNTLQYIDRTNENAILITLDQEKAIHRVDRTFLLKVLDKLGFCSAFRHWIITLYNNASTRIIVNSWLTPAVNLQRGVRQGDALFPQLYILAAEVLAAHIKNCAEIKGFLLPGAGGTNFTMSQHADDTTILVKDYNSMQQMFERVQEYERATSACPKCPPHMPESEPAKDRNSSSEEEQDCICIFATASTATNDSEPTTNNQTKQTGNRTAEQQMYRTGFNQCLAQVFTNCLRR